MPEHPQYAMWKARHEAEVAAARARALRRAEQQGPEHQHAWESYERHWREGLTRGLPWRPHWSDFRGWLRFLFVKDRHRKED